MFLAGESQTQNSPSGLPVVAVDNGWLGHLQMAELGLAVRVLLDDLEMNSIATE